VSGGRSAPNYRISATAFPVDGVSSGGWVRTVTPLARRQRRIRACETPTDRAAPVMSTVPFSYKVTAVRSVSARIGYTPTQ
jgi:hypothetical protein